MYKRILVLVAAVLVAGALAACGGSGSSSSGTSSIQAPKDIISESRIFLTDAQEWGNEYIVVYAGKDTGALTKVQDIVHFFQGGNVTREDLEAFDADSFFPSFSTLDFATKEIEEKSTMKEGDILEIKFTFDDLKNKEHLLKLHELGILTMEDTNADYLTAESMCDMLLSKGDTEVESSERLGRGLPLL